MVEARRTADMDHDYEYDENRTSTPSHLPPVNDELAPILEDLERDLIQEVMDDIREQVSPTTTRVGVARSLGTGGWGGHVTIQI